MPKDATTGGRGLIARQCGNGIASAVDVFGYQTWTEKGSLQGFHQPAGSHCSKHHTVARSTTIKATSIVEMPTRILPTGRTGITAGGRAPC